MSSIAPPAHRRSKHANDSWITPRAVLEALGPFDLDPCACNPQPWPTAEAMIAPPDDGLLYLWHGFVWCNPPYGKNLFVWLNRMALHNNGIAMTFARTDTRAFQEQVFPFATAILFLRGRITFSTPDGTPSRTGHNSGGPSVLIAYGAEAKRRLEANHNLGSYPMKIIYKYQLAFPQTDLSLPAGAEILDAQLQGGFPVMWVLQDSDPLADKQRRRFQVVPTGEEFDADHAAYIATFQMSHLVWHLFEVR